MVLSPRIYPNMVDGITEGDPSVTCRFRDVLGRASACVTCRGTLMDWVELVHVVICRFPNGL